MRLEVLDLTGRRVCTLLNETRAAGTYRVNWSGRDDADRTVSAGLYFVRLEAGARATTCRVAFTP